MTHYELFGCKYPIVAAPMNKVSDLGLAVACFEAGIFPSLSLYNQIENNKVSLNGLVRVVNEFQSKTGSNKILLSLTTRDFFKVDVQSVILNNNISHLEIIDDTDIVKSLKWIQFLEVLQEFKKQNIKIILKALDSNNIDVNIDAVMLKGSLGAGRGLEYIDVDLELLKIKRNFPSVPVIVAGGIGKRHQLKKYMNLGSTAIAIGTLLAASAESCISKETKEKMIASSYNDVTRLQGVRQNALVFSKTEDDDYNNTKGLVMGINNPSEGHVFAGKAIDDITEILPVKVIIENLTKDLVF